MAKYLLGAGFVFTMLSLLLLALSIAGFLPRLVYVQCGLFMLNLTAGFRPKKKSKGLLARSLRHLRPFQASRDDSYQSLPTESLDGPLPLPNAHLPGQRPPQH